MKATLSTSAILFASLTLTGIPFAAQATSGSADAVPPVIVSPPLQNTCDPATMVGKKPSDIDWAAKFRAQPVKIAETPDKVTMIFATGEVSLGLDANGYINAISCSMADTSGVSLVPVVPEDKQADSCNYARLIGQKESEINRAEEFGDTAKIRILHPGDMVTMEYMEGRINLTVDDDGVIKSVTCG